MNKHRFALGALLFVGLKVVAAADIAVSHHPTLGQSASADAQKRTIEMHIARASHEYSGLKPLLPGMAAHCTKKCSDADWLAVAAKFYVAEDALKRMVSAKAACEKTVDFKSHTYDNEDLLYLCTAFMLAEEELTKQSEAAASE